jgi:hypothetical protein
VFKPQDLQKFLDNNMNVLIEGPHGIGKTEMLKELFNKNNLNWKYFSSPTIDVWTDFVGVPRASEPDDNGKQHLEMILPKDFAYDEVEALFFDEFNRAQDKTTNAVMELLQFKSINGRKFNNLRVVWAAINPYTEDEIYQVQPLDPAIRDRFHAHLEVRQDWINSAYFKKKHGKVSEIFVKWWKENEVYRLVSPRRLDYAITAHSLGLNLDFFLPVKSNIKDLKTRLSVVLNKKIETDKIDEPFVLKENGDYSLEEANNALAQKIKISINLNNSMAIIKTIKNDASQFPIMNYLHQEVLSEAMVPSKANGKLMISIDANNKLIEANNKLTEQMTASKKPIPQAQVQQLQQLQADNAKLSKQMQANNKAGRQMHYNYMKYFDKNLSGPLNFSEDTLRQMRFQVNGFPDDCPGLEKSYFFKTYLDKIQLS